MICMKSSEVKYSSERKIRAQPGWMSRSLNITSKGTTKDPVERPKATYWLTSVSACEASFSVEAREEGDGDEHDDNATNKIADKTRGQLLEERKEKAEAAKQARLAKEETTGVAKETAKEGEESDAMDETAEEKTPESQQRRRMLRKRKRL